MRENDLRVLDHITLRDLEIALDGHTRELAKVTEYTAFSWSFSRHQMFERCKRQYYLNYYAARRVQEAHERAISAIWWLKQVTLLSAWVGQVIHQLAGWAVKAHRDRQPIEQEGLIRQALAFYHGGINASLRGAKHEGQWRVLFEHVYPDDPYSIDRDTAEVALVDLANTFFESEAWEMIRGMAPEAVREVDTPFQSFVLTDVPRIGEVRAFAIPDVLLQYDDSITIIDWKTGDVSRESIRDQAGVYRLYAHLTYGVPEEAIEVVIADLGNYGESVEPPGGTPPVAESRLLALHSIQDMVARMEDIRYNTASIKNFPRTDNLALCQWCGFKRACWRHEASND